VRVENRKLDQPILPEELTCLHHALVAKLTALQRRVEVDDAEELGECQSSLDVELNHCQLLAFLLLDVQAEEFLLILSDHQHVGVFCGQVLPIFELICLDLFDNLLKQALLPLSDREVLFLRLLDGIDVVRDATLVHVRLVTALNSVVDATDEWLVHDVLVAQIWQLFRGRGVDVAALFLLSTPLLLLGGANPRLVC